MSIKSKNTTSYKSLRSIHSYEQGDVKISILADKLSNLYWKKKEGQLFPLSEMPWIFQVPFYLAFLHDDKLAARFKDMEIIDAIDLFIRENYL